MNSPFKVIIKLGRDVRLYVEVYRAMPIAELRRSARQAIIDYHKPDQYQRQKILNAKMTLINSGKTLEDNNQVHMYNLSETTEVLVLFDDASIFADKPQPQSYSQSNQFNQQQQPQSFPMGHQYNIGVQSNPNHNSFGAHPNNTSMMSNPNTMNNSNPNYNNFGGPTLANPSMPMNNMSVMSNPNSNPNINPHMNNSSMMSNPNTMNNPNPNYNNNFGATTLSNPSMPNYSNYNNAPTPTHNQSSNLFNNNIYQQQQQQNNNNNLQQQQQHYYISPDPVFYCDTCKQAKQGKVVIRCATCNSDAVEYDNENSTKGICHDQCKRTTDMRRVLDCETCKQSVPDSSIIKGVHVRASRGTLCQCQKNSPSIYGHMLVEFEGCGCSVCLGNCWAAFCISKWTDNNMWNGKPGLGFGICCPRHNQNIVTDKLLFRLVKFEDIFKERCLANTGNPAYNNY